MLASLLPGGQSRAQPGGRPSGSVRACVPPGGHAPLVLCALLWRGHLGKAPPGVPVHWWRPGGLAWERGGVAAGFRAQVLRTGFISLGRMPGWGPAGSLCRPGGLSWPLVWLRMRRGVSWEASSLCPEPSSPEGPGLTWGCGEAWAAGGGGLVRAPPPPRQPPAWPSASCLMGASSAELSPCHASAHPRMIKGLSVCERLAASAGLHHVRAGGLLPSPPGRACLGAGLSWVILAWGQLSRWTVTVTDRGHVHRVQTSSGTLWSL